MSKPKGLEITHEQLEAILKDAAWLPFLVFDNSGNVFVDLKKYSDNKFYLPVKSEFQSSVVGFFFMKDLFKCPYRSQDDMVCIHAPRPKEYEITYEKYEQPVFEPTTMIESDPSFTPNYKTTTEYRKVIKELA